MNNNPLRQRRAGVLLHPTSLPSGILDKDAERWLDWMHGCGFSIWQMLPLVIPDETGSPYQSCSTFAMNPALIEDYPLKTELDEPAVKVFREKQSAWLDDFALYQVLKETFGSKPWYEWPTPFRERDSEALQQIAADNAEQIDLIVWQQFQLHRRWSEIRQEARERNVYLFGDLPIFVALDSADVWSNRDQFLLDGNGKPTYIAGVPPDYFSETGQRWGNPHYNWEAMQANGFDWWMARLHHMLQLFDIVRIDHFRGLQAVWMIDADCETAIDGFWQEVPGDKLLESLLMESGELPIVAEDLGVITPEVVELRDRFDLPGMSVLQFAFDAFDDNPHKPKNIDRNRVVYTGTHDNNTTAGWFESLKPNEQNFVFEVLKCEPREDAAQLLVETACHTLANTVIIPLQDLLQLGSEARMNTPGSTEKNWQWWFDWEWLNEDNCTQFRQLITATGRLHE